MFGEPGNFFKRPEKPYRHDDSTCPGRRYNPNAQEPDPLSLLREKVVEALIRLDTDPENVYRGARAVFARGVNSSKVSTFCGVNDVIVGYNIIERRRGSNETLREFRLRTS